MTPADPILPVVIGLAVILVASRLGGDLAVRLGQPPVLGELLTGVVLGNLALVGYEGAGFMKANVTLDMLAQLGVLLLLFEVGLESSVPQMMRVGLSAFAVAVLGVIAPFALGWAVGAWLLPHESSYVHVFLGATLCATSVGITARVLRDLGKSQTDEARIILGAAVIDDILGLLILATVTGLIAAAGQGTGVTAAGLAWMLGKAMLFLVGSLVLGIWLSPRFLALGSRLRAPAVLLSFGLSFCFFLAWLAGRAGLAPIVGAFAAGLILEDLHYRPFTDRGDHSLEELVHPISSFLVPIFFVVIGMHTDLRVFADPAALGLAGALTIAAVAGKQACSLGLIGRGIRGKRIDRLSIGLGMIPRGEVGLIFASLGRDVSLDGRAMIDARTFAAIVIMVIATTLMTPPALTWSFGRK